jgi:antitoxin HicB
MRTYTILLYRDPNEGVWYGKVPAVLGVFSDGDTREEAIANTTEALEAMLEFLIEDGQVLPQDAFDLETAKRDATELIEGVTLEFDTHQVRIHARVDTVAA